MVSLAIQKGARAPLLLYHQHLETLILSSSDEGKRQAWRSLSYRCRPNSILSLARSTVFPRVRDKSTKEFLWARLSASEGGFKERGCAATQRRIRRIVEDERGDKIPKAIPRQKCSYALKKPESVLVQVMLWVVESRVLVHCNRQNLSIRPTQ